MSRPATARRPAPVVGGNAVLCVPHVRNSPVNFTDPTGHRECQILCEGDTINEQEIKFGAAYGGEWDPEQQAANRQTAETVLVDAPKTILGFLWEPADWYNALVDGFQWHDSIGMLPLIPASVGRYGDEALDLLRTQGDNIVYRALRADERQGIANGIFGRSSANDVNPVSHVAGARNSPWISTGTKYRKIRDRFDSGNGIAVIDLSKVTSEIVDFSNGIPGMEGNRLSNFARAFGEKLVRDFIPPEAIVRIID